ncbi:MAG: ankyrin repeat domain-containing protein [Planctomycetes bacterium]|nr:ankyrin repeat domain-containing protein [Planctomycetota bacterium]
MGNRSNSPRPPSPHAALALGVVFAAALCLGSCGGNGGSAAPGGTTPSGAASPSVDPGILGLWIDDRARLLQIFPDGTYATFAMNTADEELRRQEITVNERGEPVMPSVLRDAGWVVEDGKLTAWRLVQKKEGLERVAARSYRHLAAEEWRHYRQTAAVRFVRHGDLDEIVAAEASGIDFAQLGFDALAVAAEHGRREILDHLVDRGLDLAASGAAAAAMARGDAALLAHVLDLGFPLQQVLPTAEADRGSYGDDVWALLIERGYRFGDAVPVPVLGASHPRAGSLLVERGIYTDRRLLSAVAAAGRTDLIDKVLADHPMLAERPDLLYSTGVVAAIETGQLTALEKLVALGAPLDQRFGQQSTLTRAVAAGHTDVVGYLLAAGLDPNQADGRNRTPLDAAIAADCAPAVFELLFEKGAEPAARHLVAIDRAMKVNQATVKALFEQRLGR